MTDFELFIKKNNLKKSDIATFLGVSNAFITQLCNESRGIPDDKFALIKANQDWDSSMLPAPASIIARATNNSKATVTIGSHNRSESRVGPKTPVEIQSNPDLIPLIPFEAHAGRLSDYAEAATLAQCEMFLSPMKGATCAIRITGDSMQPKYESGSIAVLKKINEQIFLEYGKTYVLDTENGAVIKTIQPTDKADVIECISINPKYPPFTIETKYILGWYRVIGVWSFE